LDVAWLDISPGRKCLLAGGMPLLFVFQLLIARSPIRHFGSRSAVIFRLPWVGYLITAAFMLYPVYSLVHGWNASWLGRSTLAHLRRARSGPAGFHALQFIVPRPSIIALLLWDSRSHRRRRDALTTLSLKRSIAFSGPMLIGAFGDFLLYLPICFLLEEVFFRGALDSFVHRTNDPLPWLSAGFISLLWGLWHLPTLGTDKLATIALSP